MEEINLKELLNYFKSKIGLIILILFCVITIGNSFTILTRVPMYQSTTKIVLVSENVNQSDQALNRNLVGTYSEIIKSRTVLSNVINNLGIDESVAELSKNITVTAVTNTEVIIITVANDNSEDAKLIADETAEVFIKEIQKIYKLNNVSVIDKAQESSEPFNVNYIKDNLIYIAIGLILGFGIAFVMYYFDTTIKTSSEIEDKLGENVLGAVPKEDSAVDLVINVNPKSIFSEAIKSIRTNLAFSSIDKDIKVILNTSPEASDGKSFISANLAVAYAQTDKRVLIIDCDLRRGRQHEVFEVMNPTSGGYSNLILNYGEGIVIGDYVSRTNVKGVDMIPTGPTPPNPVELLSSDNNRRLLNRLKRLYDIIILDCPPVLGLSDAMVLTQFSDVNLVVVSAKKTKIENLEKTKKQFEQVKAEIAGVILNKAETTHNEQYGYYYNDYFKDNTETTKSKGSTKKKQKSKK